MDRDRLKDVKQTDLTESRVNEDFVDWLKNKGPTYLLVIMVALVAYLGIVRWRQSKVSHRSEAWTDYFNAQLPTSLDDVAQQYPDVDGVATLARLTAADELLRSVQQGVELGETTPAMSDGAPALPTETALTDEERERYLARAADFYQQVVDGDRGKLKDAIFGINARNGLAAVAEARGDLDAARAWYAKSAERAEPVFPGLARQARHRAESLSTIERTVTFRSLSELTSVRGQPEQIEAVNIDEALRDLVLPPEPSDESAGSTE